MGNALVKRKAGDVCRNKPHTLLYSMQFLLEARGPTELVQAVNAALPQQMKVR